MIIGAHYQTGGGCEFVVWAPYRKNVTLKVITSKESFYPMEKDRWGYWRTSVGDIAPGDNYLYCLDRKFERPDPASYFQPQGIHTPSAIIDHNNFHWNDHNWRCPALSQWIIYELHVGTFTSEGTFQAIIARLDDLIDLGINAIELMPVAQFSGNRNWGYDGVYPFAVQNTYGGPDHLKQFVDACHQRGIAVILDVVYNHFGPEGNYFNDFGPYFTSKYSTPWGKALNFDDRYSDHVRNFFIMNALYWFENFHFDGLRLDAIQAINDDSAKPFLIELNEKIHEWSQKNKRNVYLIAESDLNDVKIIQPQKNKGFGMDAQWSDDFHHSVHSLLTGEKNKYYQDFGSLEDLSKAFKKTFVYSWTYSEFRKRYHGSDAQKIPGEKFVVSIQNHDQVGNRLAGERLSNLISFEKLKIAAGLMLLSPYIPLLFMGEEYGEENPFLYFVSHSEDWIIESVRKGRRAEYSLGKKDFTFFDPQDEQSFSRSKLNWAKKEHGNHQLLRNYYKKLISLRKRKKVLLELNKKNMEVFYELKDEIFYFRRWLKNEQILVLVNFSNTEKTMNLKIPNAQWTKILDSRDKKWGGTRIVSSKEIYNSANVKLGPENLAVYQLTS
ncbi:MAG: malto-oligosyltrehalose trehalohydrolase [Candidatus Omnitrophica bacterium]|nr:malto-oligosyltrehalose trehalohydrolase [Candidatus Omnitrophota bacterium]MCB9747307.1 malto-oligosyltrehalose trehalohydrolase [Candidatus Omnitrophota bacterium]